MCFFFSWIVAHQVTRGGQNLPNPTACPALQKPNFRLKNADLGLKFQDSYRAGRVIDFSF
jgi:hypothetical protein